MARASSAHSKRNSHYHNVAESSRVDAVGSFKAAVGFLRLVLNGCPSSSAHRISRPLSIASSPLFRLYRFKAPLSIFTSVSIDPDCPFPPPTSHLLRRLSDARCFPSVGGVPSI